MKIAHLCPYPMGRPGGVQSHVRDLQSWMIGQGHEIVIVCPPSDGDQTNGVWTLGHARPVTMHGTGFEITFAKRRERQTVVRRLREWGVDLLHLHTPWTPALAWQIWRHFDDTPSVATFHATLPSTNAKGPVDRYIRTAIKHFDRHLDAIIVPSTAPKSQLNTLGLRHDPIVLPPTIDLSEWMSARNTDSSVCAPKILFLGRFEARKGVATLLRAWSQIQEHLPTATLRLAGRGELPTPPGMPTSQLDVVHNPDDSTARRLVAEADFLVAPSEYAESFGLILIEAMAAGTVPIAAANSGYRTVMDGPGAELLFRPGDANALAEKVIDMASKPDMYQNLRQWGIDHAAAFDVRSVGPKYVALYEKVLARR